ncbi:tetratricopeptide repeat protein [Nannocystaceae bacterium ST9]
MPGLGDTTIGGDDRPARASTPTRIERGTSLGRYVVLQQLGRGGMGVVYAAFDPQLDRKVALKLLHAQPNDGLETSDGRPRLLREAQALAKLAHPNVITIHDVGTVDGAVFIAMEFIEGQTLGDWIGARRSWREVVAMFVAAGRGIAAAHRAGIVHRDFKPDNVMIGKDGRPRVLDFGLARAADLGEVARAPIDPTLDVSLLRSSTLDTKLTMTGAMMGTPAYMAPEQHFGRAVDERSDQFAFCVSLYEALYAERPFAGDNLAALSVSVTAGEVREPPASAAVPGWLRKVVLRGLAVEPAARWPSMDALLRELDRDPTRARRSALVGVGSLAVLVGALLLGQRDLDEAEPTLCTGAEQHLVGAWDLDTRAALHDAFVASGTVYAEDSFRGFAATLDGYAREWTGMHGEACEATRIRGEQSDEVLTLRMACLDRGREQLAALVEVYRAADAPMVERSLEAAESLPPLRLCADVEALTLGVRPPETEDQRRQVEALRGRVDAARSLGLAGRQAEAREQLAALLPEVDATGYRPLIAEAELARGTALEATDLQIAALERAVWMAEVSRHDRVVAEAWILLIKAYGVGANDYPRARDAVARADAAIERIAGDPELRIRLDVAHGSMLSSLGERREALVMLRRARAARVAAGQGGSPIALNELVALTNTLTTDHQALEARVLLDDALSLAVPMLGADHPWVARLRGTLGRVLYQTGNLEAAEAETRAALAVFERVNGEDSPQVAAVLNGLAVILDEQRRFDEALACYRRAVEIFRRNYGPRHYNVAVGLHNIGMIEVERGEVEAGLADIEAALAIKIEVRGPDSAVAGWDRNAAGDALVLLGRYEEAAEHYRTTLATVASDEHGPIVNATVGLARAELGMGRRGEARRLLELNQPRAYTASSVTSGLQHFALAKLVWDDGEHARARGLAERARDRYAVAGVYYQPELDEIDAWLAAHPSE